MGGQQAVTYRDTVEAYGDRRASPDTIWVPLLLSERNFNEICIDLTFGLRFKINGSHRCHLILMKFSIMQYIITRHNLSPFAFVWMKFAQDSMKTF